MSSVSLYYTEFKSIDQLIDLSVDERSQLERLQNKLRQREKQRLLREEVIISLCLL
jgi:hypothetical protein